MKAKHILSIVLAIALGLTSCQKDIQAPDEAAPEVPAVGFDENGASLALFSVAEGHTVRFSRDLYGYAVRPVLDIKHD